VSIRESFPLLASSCLQYGFQSYRKCGVWTGSRVDLCEDNSQLLFHRCLLAEAAEHCLVTKPCHAAEWKGDWSEN